jgi:hypothetical protein
MQRMLRPDLPHVLPGIEVHAARNALLLAVGLKGHVPIKLASKGDEQTREWIMQIHRLQRGAVIALNLDRVASDVGWLEGLGVDAIEVANRGHPEIKADMRAALRTANDAGLPLVASSDLHGWGVLWDTWTVIRRSVNAATPEAAVMLALTEHRAEDIYPVSSHPVGAMSRADAVISPFVSIFEYARKLSLPRLFSWWIWFVIIAIAWRTHGRLILALCMMTLCSGFVYQGSTLLLMWARGVTSGGFAGVIGAVACAIGAGALLSVWVIFGRKGSKRREVVSTEENAY